MARKKPSLPTGFVLFDVFYEDGSQTSNRRIPAAELSSLDGDAPARAFIEAQDREIGAVSGIPRGRIKTIARARKVSGTKSSVGKSSAGKSSMHKASGAKG
jgi:hypothetical protein